MDNEGLNQASAGLVNEPISAGLLGRRSRVVIAPRSMIDQSSGMRFESIVTPRKNNGFNSYGDTRDIAKRYREINYTAHTQNVESMPSMPELTRRPHNVTNNKFAARNNV